MAWTTPPTFTADTELAAADLNLLGDDLNYLKAQTDLAVFSGVLVDRNGATQSVATATPSLIVWTREPVDEGGWITVSSTDITVPAGAIPAGYTTVILEVDIYVQFASNATGYRKFTLLVDGADGPGDGTPALNGAPTDLGRSWKVAVEAGTVLQLEVSHNAGSNLNVTNVGMWLSVHKPLS